MTFKNSFFQAPRCPPVQCGGLIDPPRPGKLESGQSGLLLDTLLPGLLENRTLDSGVQWT